MSRIDCTRRYFLAATCRVAAVGLGGAAQNLLAGELPPASNPRATDGDQRHEPVWEKSLTITVGPKQADLVSGRLSMLMSLGGVMTTIMRPIVGKAPAHSMEVEP